MARKTSINLLKDLPVPRRIPKTAEDFHQLGEGIFMDAADPKKATRYGITAGVMEAGGQELPFAKWQRGSLDFVALDRRRVERAGGFALFVLNVPPGREAVDAEVYIFGASEV